MATKIEVLNHFVSCGYNAISYKDGSHVMCKNNTIITITDNEVIISHCLRAYGTNPGASMLFATIHYSIEECSIPDCGFLRLPAPKKVVMC